MSETEELRQLVEMVIGVQMSNCADMVADPEGQHPACKPAIGTSICERCGSIVTGKQTACEAVPRDQRWRFR